MSRVCRVVDANVNVAVQELFEAAEEKVLEGEVEEEVEGGMLYDVSVDWKCYTPDLHRQELNAPKCPVFDAACSLHF